jgi:arginase family enzyme
MMVAVKQLQTVSLGVEIIIAAGSQMVGQSLRVLIQIDLDVLDPAV